MTFFIGIVFAMLCFIVIEAAMKPTSKSQFCGSQCHEMQVAYQSWELSVHGTNKYGIQVGCVDCHLPPKEKEYFAHIFAKAYEGGKDFFKILTIKRQVVKLGAGDCWRTCRGICKEKGQPLAAAPQLED